MAWASAEWHVPIAFPEYPLGTFGGTGRSATLIPWLAAGWAGDPVAGHAAPVSRGVDASLGVGLSLLHDLLRLDAGFGLRSGDLRGAMDVSRLFWDIL